MADRVSSSITIGGDLSRDLLLDFAAIINAEGLSIDWDGEDFTLSQLPADVALTLMAHEVAWGRFEGLESFCVTNRLPFARWSGAYAGQWGAERVVYHGEPETYAADEDDCIHVCRETIERLGSLEAVRAYFDAADFAVPSIRVASG